MVCCDRRLKQQPRCLHRHCHWRRLLVSRSAARCCSQLLRRRGGAVLAALRVRPLCRTPVRHRVLVAVLALAALRHAAAAAATAQAAASSGEHEQEGGQAPPPLGVAEAKDDVAMVTRVVPAATHALAEWELSGEGASAPGGRRAGADAGVRRRANFGALERAALRLIRQTRPSRPSAMWRQRPPAYLGPMRVDASLGPRVGGGRGYVAAEDLVPSVLLLSEAPLIRWPEGAVARRPARRRRRRSSRCSSRRSTTRR